MPNNVPIIEMRDLVAQLHGRRTRDIFVLLSEDGSTVVADPGLGRPWSSPNKQLAESKAKEISRESGRKCYAVDFETALASVLKHAKNQPPKGN